MKQVLKNKNHIKIKYYLQEHFEENQFEQNRADGRRKLKPNVTPTIFKVPNPPKPRSRRRILKRHTASTQGKHISKQIY